MSKFLTSAHWNKSLSLTRYISLSITNARNWRNAIWLAVVTSVMVPSRWGLLIVQAKLKSGWKLTASNDKGECGRACAMKGNRSPLTQHTQVLSYKIMSHQVSETWGPEGIPPQVKYSFVKYFLQSCVRTTYAAVFCRLISHSKPWIGCEHHSFYSFHIFFKIMFW